MITRFKTYESITHTPKYKVGDYVYFKTLSNAIDYGIYPSLNKSYRITDVKEYKYGNYNYSIEGFSNAYFGEDNFISEIDIDANKYNI